MKKLLSALLATAMLLSMVPAMAFAAEGETPADEYTEEIIEMEELGEPEGVEPAAPEDEEPTTPEDEEPTTPEDEEPAAPEDEEPTTPEDEEPTAPEDEDSTDPEDEEPTAPEDEEPTTPEDEEPTDPEDEESTAPEGEEVSVAEDTDSIIAVSTLAIPFEGTGTADDPYRIYTIEEFVQFIELVNSYTGADFYHYKLMTDLNLTTYPFPGGWTPIGEHLNAYVFRGTFDGNNHIISAPKMNSNSMYMGLFGRVSGEI